MSQHLFHLSPRDQLDREPLPQTKLRCIPRRIHTMGEQCNLSQKGNAKENGSRKRPPGTKERQCTVKQPINQQTVIALHPVRKGGNDPLLFLDLPPLFFRRLVERFCKIPQPVCECHREGEESPSQSDEIEVLCELSPRCTLLCRVCVRTRGCNIQQHQQKCIQTKARKRQAQTTKNRNVDGAVEDDQPDIQYDPLEEFQRLRALNNRFSRHSFNQMAFNQDNVNETTE
mmetsp:Transcript_37002/g.72780  ORF Transcript_37002/g.72780 Transcript_37002/m.72780 type:complete len:229 (-) Transcript_37002:196-882(-)